MLGMPFRRQMSSACRPMGPEGWTEGDGIGVHSGPHTLLLVDRAFTYDPPPPPRACTLTPPHVHLPPLSIPPLGGGDRHLAHEQ